MMSNLKTISTEVFEGLSAKDKVLRFNEFEAKAMSLSGEWLENMFQSKVYQDLGYSNFKSFVDKELSISNGTADTRRKAFSILKVENETENDLKDDVIEADIVTMLDSIPRGDKIEFKELTIEEQTKAVENVERFGKKTAWYTHSFSEAILQDLEGMNEKDFKTFSLEAESITKRCGTDKQAEKAYFKIKEEYRVAKARLTISKKIEEDKMQNKKNRETERQKTLVTVKLDPNTQVETLRVIAKFAHDNGFQFKSFVENLRVEAQAIGWVKKGEQ